MSKVVQVNLDLSSYTRLNVRVPDAWDGDEQTVKEAVTQHLGNQIIEILVDADLEVLGDAGDQSSCDINLSEEEEDEDDE